ncbi:MAG: TatD family hydrolase, partial [Bacteroidales bacterium]|nr:TatD family hydrolase [Bacteroidales bacterium]
MNFDTILNDIERERAENTAPDLVDIGLNLASDRFDADREEVLARAREAGVGFWLLTGTSVAVSEQAIQLCQQFDGEHPGRLRCTVGVHPHEADHYSSETGAQLLALARENRRWVAAIGETGLDFNRN